MRSRSLIASFNYAIEGIVYALRTQRNMRLHMTAAVLVLAASLFFEIGRTEFIVIVFSIAFVFMAELANTAIEAAVDVATQSFDPLAKIAKDVAAGAVLVSAINAVIVGYIIFFARINNVSDLLITRVRQTPAHLTLIAIMLTGLLVLVGKAITKRGTWMQGGWPSGHAAIASASASAIAYITRSAGAAVLAGFIAVLVAQSRVEGKIHSVAQVIAGALLGILVTTLIFQVSSF